MKRENPALEEEKGLIEIRGFNVIMVFDSYDREISERIDEIKEVLKTFV